MDHVLFMQSVMQTLFLRGAVLVCRFQSGRIHLYESRAQKAGGSEKSNVLTEGLLCGQLGREGHEVQEVGTVSFLG